MSIKDRINVRYFSIQTTISFTEEELRTLMQSAVEHYDSVCKQQEVQFRWALEHPEKDGTHYMWATTKEVDIWLKTTEQRLINGDDAPRKAIHRRLNEIFNFLKHEADVALANYRKTP